MASHIAASTRATTIPHHTAGEVRFELPLRGESFEEWLNSPVLCAFMGNPVWFQGLERERA
jgi:hypothetical protein